MPTFLERLSAQKFSSAASTAIDVFVSGDSTARLAVDAGGKLSWSPGSGTADVNLYRNSGNHLQTDDYFKAMLGVENLTYGAKPTHTVPDGHIAIDTTNKALYFRADSTWVASNAMSLTDADGGDSTAWIRYQIAADGGANGASL